MNFYSILTIYPASIDKRLKLTLNSSAENIGTFRYFRNKKWLNNKTELYLAYAALEDRIISYLVTQEFFVNKGSAESQKITKPTQVIQSIDSELATLNNIAIGFDSTKIPNYQELYKTIPSIN